MERCSAFMILAHAKVEERRQLEASGGAVSLGCLCPLLSFRNRVDVPWTALGGPLRGLSGPAAAG